MKNTMLSFYRKGENNMFSFMRKGKNNRNEKETEVAELIEDSFICNDDANILILESVKNYDCTIVLYDGRIFKIHVKEL